MTTTTRATYSVETTTGADCVDGSGLRTGPESTGHVVSRHRTREAAERAVREFVRVCPTERDRVAIFVR